MNDEHAVESSADVVVMSVTSLDESNLDLVSKAFAAGHAVFLMPSGHRSKMRRYADSLNNLAVALEAKGK